MSFRTIMMLAIAALVIIVAINMNRSHQSELANPTMEEGVVIKDSPAPAMAVETGDESPLNADVPEEVQNQETKVDTTEPLSPEAPVGVDPVSADKAVSEPVVTKDGTVIMETPEEADKLAPAAVDESPAKKLEDGPAEDVSSEPVQPVAPKAE